MRGIVAFFLATWVLASATEAEVVGRVKTLTGVGYLVTRDARIPLVVGSPISIGDTVATGADGSVGVTFADETRISIGPSSEITIDEFAYARSKKRASFVTRMSRGTLHYVSGLIVKWAPEKVSVVTPDGTVGIRGTRFVVRVNDDQGRSSSWFPVAGASAAAPTS